MDRLMKIYAALVLMCISGGLLSAQGGYGVSGVVVDQIGPVAGAAIIEQGTSNGTVAKDDPDCEHSFRNMERLYQRRHSFGLRNPPGRRIQTAYKFLEPEP